LDDPATGGLWSDTELNSALAAAAAAIGRMFPVETSSSVSIALDASTAPHPTGCLSVSELQAPSGEILENEPNPTGPASNYAALTWRSFGATILFSRPLRTEEAGSWTIRYRAARVMPTSDATTLDWPDSLIPALALTAAAHALRARFADDAKRGNQTSYVHSQLVPALERAARIITDAHKRTARGSRMT
jgi:hypothetical protein